MLSSRPALLRTCAAARRSVPVRCEGSSAPKQPSKAKAKAQPKADKSAKVAKPPRAPTAYNLFFKAEYANVKKEYPEAGLAQAAGLIRDKWAKADSTVKAPFEREAAEAKAKVDAQKAVALAEKKAKAKPLSAYMLFAQKNRPAVMAANPGKPITEIAALLGQAWTELPDEEKQKYKDESKAAMDAWKAKQEPSA